MKRMMGWVTLLLLLVGVGAAGAQDAPAGCEVDGLRTLIADALAASEGQDGGAFMDVLTGIADRIYATRAACEGMHFTDEGRRQAVLGPVTLDDGVYRVVVVAAWHFAAELEVVEGECRTPQYDLLFSLQMNDGADGAESAIVSEGCTAIIQVYDAAGPWELTIEDV